MTVTSTTTPAPTTTPASPPALARLAGGLGLAHVVLVFAAVSQEVMVEHGASPAAVQHAYGGADLTRVFASGYVEALAFLLLVPALVLVAGLFGSGSAYARAAAQSFLALGVVYAASTLAVGFPPGAAALYAAQHGADAHTVALVNDIRNFGFVLQVSTQGAMAVALGFAALAGGLWRRTLGIGGLLLGTLVVVGAPFFTNVAGMVALVWWVALSVALLRGRPQQG